MRKAITNKLSEKVIVNIKLGFNNKFLILNQIISIVKRQNIDLVTKILPLMNNLKITLLGRINCKN